MPYKTIKSLPSQVKDNLPKKAQKIFKEAFNNAWKEYKDEKNRRGDQSREEVSNKIAWSAVKQKFRKNSEGNWIEK